jgi:hypothetical protein
MVSRAFTRLPLSTEQILHAEKYLSYERPVKVLLPDLTSLLNAGGEQVGVGSRQSAIGSQQSAVGSPRNPGASHAAGVESRAIHGRVNRRSLTAAQRTLPAGAWHHIDTDVNGEWGYYLILDQFLNTAAESKRATAGWAGDRYALYEGPTGQVFVAESTAWDTENDAREFLDAYVKRTELRYPNATQVDASAMEPAARNSKLETGVRHSWRTSEGTVVLEQRGNRVVILEGIPADADSNALLQALWR